GVVRNAAYQAESDLNALLRPHYARVDQEGRTLLHELFAIAIEAFIKHQNDNPKPLRWTKSADDVLASIERFCRRTLDLIVRTYLACSYATSLHQLRPSIAATIQLPLHSRLCTRTCLSSPQ